MSAAARVDVVVIGGGISGMWARAALRRAGFSVVLAESHGLGAGQTVASQGILHRGVKYALSAEAREASDMLASAQETWRWSLGLIDTSAPPPIDLRGVRVLSTRMHLWAAGLMEKATGVGAALAMRSDVRKLPRAEFPDCFREAPGSVAVWEVDEVTIDPASLVTRLAGAADGAVLHAAPDAGSLREDHAGGVAITLRGAGERCCELWAQAMVLAAGEGNEPLLAGLGVQSAMQRRPLHMVLADGAPGPVFAHLPRPGSDKPRLSITSARTQRGWCWYIGGDAAETGVSRSREAQIEFAREEVARHLGWLDLSQARWATLRIDRAEGQTETGRRPDGPVLRRSGRTIAIWPTKLALAPIAAQLIEGELRELNVAPSGQAPPDVADWPAPPVALPPWNRPEVQWS